MEDRDRRNLDGFMSELKKNVSPMSYGSELNAQEFFIRSIVKRMISTAIPVRVDAVERAGEDRGALYVDATPLICQTDADGNALDPVSIPHLPYFRLQHGTAAVICDPKVGDIGLAIFAQQDVSRLNGQTTPVAPGTFRCFDMSDGFYIGGFWGQKPTTFIHIEDSGHVTITAPEAVVVNTTTATVNSSGSTTVDSPTVTITGDTTVQKTLTVLGQITGTGGLAVSGGSGASVTGNVSVSGGDVTADGVGLKSHTHTCPHGGNTSTGQG